MMRLSALTLTFAIVGCSWQRPNAVAACDLAGVPAKPQAASSGVAPASELLNANPTTERAQTDEPVQQTGFVPSPRLRSAIGDASGLPEPQGTITASVMARVNGQPILSEEVLNAASGKLLELKEQVPEDEWPAVQAKIIQAVLDEMINRELVIQDATSRIRPQALEKVKSAAEKEFNSLMRKRKEQLKIKTDEELRAFMSKRGFSLDEEQKQYERQFLATEYIRSVVRDKTEAEVTREKMLEYYQKNIKEFERAERVVWQHIFIDADRFPNKEAARQYAQQVLTLVQNILTKEEFGPLAEKYSHGPSQYRRGEGEGGERGQIRPEQLEDLLFSLKPGQAGPIVEAAHGFHIVRLVEYHQAGKTSFEVAVPDIRRKLQNKLGQAEYTRMLKELRSKAYIETALTSSK